MRYALRVILAVVVVCVSMSAQGSWRPLFDGHSVEGWEHAGPGEVKLENGLLVTRGGMGLLWYTREKFGDCTLRVIFKTEKPESNSGIFVRIADAPSKHDKPEWFAVHHGYEVQIHDAIDDFHRTGAIYSFAKPRELASKPAGEWNTMEVELKGDLIRVTLNGTLVNSFDPKRAVPQRKEWYEPKRGPRPQVGYIGLQNHAEGDTVWFKEVSIKNFSAADER